MKKKIDPFTGKPVLTHSQNLKRLVARARELVDQIEANKALYKELDDLTDRLVGLGFESGGGVAIVDNFSSKNTVWKASAVRRFELKGAR